MSPRNKLENIFTNQDFSPESSTSTLVYDYARAMSQIEKRVVVVSDLHFAISLLFNGKYASMMGLSLTSTESSIWEK